MRYFCTYFDSNYLARGLALYRSLKRHSDAVTFYVLCLDRRCYEFLDKLHWPGIEPIALEDFERGDEKLLKAKDNRSPVEYYFTCTPSLPLYILAQYPEVDAITYVDADLFFFSDPEPLFEEMGGRSVAIVGHRFPPKLKHLERHGVYNVGWITFRRTESAFRCLHWWRESCLIWCYDRCEEGRFADQKYLDEWPSRFGDVAVLRHKGANVAPWNVTNHTMVVDGDRVWVADESLIFYHFHLFRKIARCLYDPNLALYTTKPSRILRRYIYGPYIRALRDIEIELDSLSKERPRSGSIREKPGQVSSGSQWRSRVKRLVVNTKGIIGRRLIIAFKGRVV